MLKVIPGRRTDDSHIKTGTLREDGASLKGAERQRKSGFIHEVAQATINMEYRRVKPPNRHRRSSRKQR